MKSSKLKLNVDKTVLIVTGTKQQQNKIVDYFTGKILGNDTSPSDTVRNLGVVFDGYFSFHQYISQVWQIMFFFHIHSTYVTSDESSGRLSL